MQWVVVRRPGGYAALRTEERPDPVPGPGCIRVRTRAVGVNYADCVVRMGLYASARHYVGWPVTPGFEFAGEVDATGPGVSPWKAGDRVVGVTRFGAYASHVVVPAQQAWRIPEGWTAEQAAGFPAVFLTAFHALHGLGAARAGQWALVHSAAGGVGGALLQLCRAAGVHAVGVVGSAAKVDAARALGAEHVLVRGDGRWWQHARALVPDGFHLVLDASGHATLRKGWDLLGPTGRLVVYGFHGMLSTWGGWPSPWSLLVGWLRMPRFNPLEMTGTNRSVMAFNLSWLFDQQDLLRDTMQTLWRLVADGKIAPAPTTSFPLARAADAHRALESGRTTGKLVLTV